MVSFKMYDLVQNFTATVLDRETVVTFLLIPRRQIGNQNEKYCKTLNYIHIYKNLLIYFVKSAKCRIVFSIKVKSRKEIIISKGQ